MVTESKRAGVEQLMHGREGGYGGEEVLFDLAEVRGGVEDDQASHFTEMKRRICGRLQRLKDCRETSAGSMAPPPLRSRGTSDGTPRRPDRPPTQRAAELEQFPVQLLKSTCFVSVQLPTPGV